MTWSVNVFDKNGKILSQEDAEKQTIKVLHSKVYPDLKEEGIPRDNFELVFTVTYNSVTLEKAAELEKLIKKFCADACKVEVEVKKSGGEHFTSIGTGSMTFENVPQIDVVPLQIDLN